MKSATLDHRSAEPTSAASAPPLTDPTTQEARPTGTATRKTAALIGLLFLTATVTFALGNALIQLSSSRPTTDAGALVAGVLLLGCVGLAVAANGVAMRRVLKPYTPMRADAYFVARAAECLTLLATGTYLLTTHPHGNGYVLPVYAVSGAAGLVVSSAMLTSRIVPRSLSILGVVGYPVFLLGTVLAMFNIIDVTHGAGMLALVPGGLFELVLPVVLFRMGFSHPAGHGVTIGTEPRPSSRSLLTDWSTSISVQSRTDCAGTIRRARLIAGAGLLAMSVLSAVGYLVAVKGLVTPWNATRTATDIMNHEGLFEFGILSLFLVATLDVVVAWALHRVFRPVSGRVSTLAAWFRIAYAGIFVIAISQLVGVIDLLNKSRNVTAVSAEHLDVQALHRITSFSDIWDAGLVVFGLHLLVIAYLAYRSGHVPKLVGALLAIAGSGYLFDSLLRVLSPHSSLTISAVTGIGEFVFAVWLVIRARHIMSVDSAALNRIPAAR